MAYRLTKTERANIENNHELMDQIVAADIIAIEERRTRKRNAIWRRPLAEVQARGLPAEIHVLCFEISTKNEGKDYRRIVERIKYRDVAPTENQGELVSADILQFDGKVSFEQVNFKDIKKGGPLKHERLDPFGEEWARQLFGRVGHILHDTFEKWELGFLQDRNYEKELFTWEAIARTHEAYMADHPTGDSKVVLSDICIATFGRPTDETIQQAELRTLYAEIGQRFQADTKRLAGGANAQESVDRLRAYLGLPPSKENA